MTSIDASGGAVFFASGVFYYFLTQQVKALVQGMADAFPGGVLVFDAANRTAVKMIAKTWLRTAKIKDVGAYFALPDTFLRQPMGSPGVIAESLPFAHHVGVEVRQGLEPVLVD